MPTLNEAITNSDSPLASVKYLIQRLGGNVYRMAGPDNARARKDWMNYIGGGKFTQAQSGVNALRAAVYVYARSHGFDDGAATCENNREDMLDAWART